MITCGLVLAAGRSERFGAANKLLVPFKDRPLAAHSADALRAVHLDHRLVVATDTAVAHLFDGFETITPDPAGAPHPQSVSLVLGAQRAIALGAERLLVALADMPLVDVALLDSVLSHATATQPAAATDGTRVMPPACFPASWLTGLTNLSGDRGAGSLLRDLPEAQRVAAPEGMLADVDRPADLDRLKVD